mmetsp:Transcript_8974/g.27224  ORF Transcript_8974/g.27224 Transcript_8974/m.27224 type:complete len:195 (-) Transcript_8974:885-1469(-)
MPRRLCTRLMRCAEGCGIARRRGARQLRVAHRPHGMPAGGGRVAGGGGCCGIAAAAGGYATLLSPSPTPQQPNTSARPRHLSTPTPQLDSDTSSASPTTSIAGAEAARVTSASPQTRRPLAASNDVKQFPAASSGSGSFRQLPESSKRDHDGPPRPSHTSASLSAAVPVAVAVADKVTVAVTVSSIKEASGAQS